MIRCLAQRKERKMSLIVESKISEMDRLNEVFQQQIAE